MEWRKLLEARLGKYGKREEQSRNPASASKCQPEASNSIKAIHTTTLNESSLP